MTRIANIKFQFEPTFKADFKKAILAEIGNKINSTKYALLISIRDRLAQLFIQALRDSPEYKSIVFYEELRGELGIPDASVLEDILLIWANGIRVDYNSDSKLGNITVKMIRSDYSDVLSSPSASFTYDSRAGGGTIDWLKWLLLEGNKIIVKKYDFYPAPRGRTRQGIMIQIKGGKWRVPTPFQGTANNNFVTRALEKIETAIDNVIRVEIGKRLK